MLREDQRKRISKFLLGNSMLRKYVLNEIVRDALEKDGLSSTDADIELYLFTHPDFKDKNKDEIESLISDLTKEMTPVPWYESFLSSTIGNFSFMSFVLFAPFVSLCEYYALLEAKDIQQRGLCIAGMVLIVVTIIVSAVVHFIKNNKSQSEPVTISVDIYQR